MIPHISCILRQQILAEPWQMRKLSPAGCIVYLNFISWVIIDCYGHHLLSLSPSTKSFQIYLPSFGTGLNTLSEIYAYVVIWGLLLEIFIAE